MLIKIGKKFNNLSIKTKFLSINLFVLCLFSVICFIGLQIVQYKSQELLYNTLASSLSYSSMELRDSLVEIESLSFHLVTDKSVQKELSEVMKNKDDILIRSQAFRELNTVLQNYKGQNKSIDSITLTNKDVRVHTNTIWAEQIREYESNGMYESGVKADGRAAWIYDDKEGDLFLARSVRRIEPFSLDSLGVLFIDISMEKLVQSSADLSGRFGISYYRLIERDHILFQTENFPQDVEKQLEQLSEDEYCIIKKDGQCYFAVVGSIPDYGWKYVQMIHYTDMYKAMVNSILLYVVIGFFGACLSILLCFMLVNRITNHISSLIYKMQKFSENNTLLPKTNYDYRNREDELGMIHRNFDLMAEKIISLIQNDYINQILMKDAKLKALEAQIDPHFLYNVLQSISWSAKAMGNVEIPRMVDALGKMLRTILSSEDETFTILNEVEFLNNYMVIQQYRFEEQLQFKLELPNEIMDLPIPKLTIQPLVENAIRYGMDGSEEVCIIEVTGTKNLSETILTVKNTGSVFEDDLLEKLELKKIKPNGFGIGILNIKQRLQLYGNGKSYLLLENENNMAVVHIHIPHII